MKNEKTKKRWLLGATIFLIIVAFVVCVAFGYFLRVAIIGNDVASLEEVYAYLRDYGVFNSDTLELEPFTGDTAASIITSGVSDGYAKYYPKEEFAAVKNAHSGNYTGIGISVYTDSLKVAKVIGNSPAFNEGVQGEDLIISGTVGGNKTEFSTLNDFTDFLAEADNEEFILETQRDGEQKFFNIKKKNYKSSYLVYMDNDSRYAFVGDSDYSLKMLDGSLPQLADDTAYISFNSFEGGAANELKAILDLMKRKNKTKLILDVRNNGGGYMDVLEAFAGGLINGNGATRLPLAYSKNNKGVFSEYKTTRSFYNTDIVKISVIANERSASATECLIGAMLYYGGAFSADNLVIENDSVTEDEARTFGKGIMQTTFTLTNGGAVKLTTAVIYQPDKATCIHGTGIRVSGANALVKSDNNALSRALEILAD